MTKLLSTDIQRSPKLDFILLFFVWLFMHIVLLNYPGIREDLYDARLYIKGAEFLLLQGRFEDTHHIFYGIPILLMASSKWLTGSVVIYIIFQSVISGLAAWSMYLSASEIFNNRRAALFSGIIFLVWWDVVVWNTAVMTDSIGCSLVCFVIYILTHFRGSLKNYTGLIALLMASFFTRPTGVLIIAGVVFYLVIYHWKHVNQKPIWRNLMVILLIVLSYVSAELLFSMWDFGRYYSTGNIVTYMDTIEGAPLYVQSLRLNTTGLDLPSMEMSGIGKIVYFIFHNPIYFLKSSVLKIFYLVSGIRPYYSWLHNGYSILWLTSIYVLFFLGCKNLNRHQPIKWFAVSVVMINCFLIGIAAVDWDNRFYLPMQPGIVLFAGGGAAYLMSWFKISPE